jgi:hypothetical protein
MRISECGFRIETVRAFPKSAIRNPQSAIIRVPQSAFKKERPASAVVAAYPFPVENGG